MNNFQHSWYLNNKNEFIISILFLNHNNQQKEINCLKILIKLLNKFILVVVIVFKVVDEEIKA